MSVSSIQGNNGLLQISSPNGGRPPRGHDGDDDEMRASSRRGGGLMAAIGNALSQIGVGSSSDSANSSSTENDSSSQDPAQAVSAFVQSLMGALHAQDTQASASQNTSGTDADGDNDGSTSAAQGHHRHHHLQADLQSLMQQLSSSNTSNSSSNSTAPSSDLEQSFKNLMSALGNTNSNATLPNFLQALSNQFAGGSKAGNAVSTSA